MSDTLSRNTLRAWQALNIQKLIPYITPDMYWADMFLKGRVLFHRTEIERQPKNEVEHNSKIVTTADGRISVH